MRHVSLKLGLGLALGLAFSGCDLTQIKKTDDDTAQPATAATVVGIWRADIVVPNPPLDIKLTMQVDAAGTMLLSQRLATGQPSPNDFVETSKEYWTWKVENGNMVSVKTTCEYKDPATMQPTGETACREPLSKTKAINVKGSAWTVVEEGQPVVFRKD
ncbi:MAG: hypothetical protein JWP91_2999 [Fibrobacteres bacterium]|nr:hypothetical protein [Fibrobacterota bacterium]